MNTFGYYDPTSAQKAAGIAGDKPEARYLAVASRSSRDAPAPLVSERPHRPGADQRAARHHAPGRDHQRGRDDAACGGRRLEGNRFLDSRPLPARRPHRRSPGSQSRTIGGSLANNDPAADYPAAVLGLGATVVAGKRKFSADDFFRGLFETALAPGELITAVGFPIPKKAGYAKFRNPRLALRGRRRIRSADVERCARRGDGRRCERRLPREGDGRSALEELVAAGDQGNYRVRRTACKATSMRARSTARTS
jgi:carbon-monoxide dehydrogenase medium subunit